MLYRPGTATAATMDREFFAPEFPQYRLSQWGTGEDLSLTLVGYEGYNATTLEIPARINDVPVTAIGYEAFANQGTLQSVTLPDTITSIERRAFTGCANLALVTLPGGITEIAATSFGGCSAALEFQCPAGSATADVLFALGYDFFDGDNYHIRDYPDFTFHLHKTEDGGDITLAAYHGDAQALHLPALINSMALTAIAENAFAGCEVLTDIALPDNIVEIGANAFACSGGTARLYCKAGSVTAQTLAALGYRFFDLSSFTDPDFLFEQRQTENGPALTLIGYVGSDRWPIVPESVDGVPVTGIGAGAFADCDGLLGVTLPDDLTYIAFGALQGELYCTAGSATASALAEQNLAFLDPKAPGYVFRQNAAGDRLSLTLVDYIGNAQMLQVPEAVSGVPITVIGEEAFASCDKLIEVVLPNGIREIGPSAFLFCENLRSVTLPEGTVSIGDRAFYHCSGLNSVSLPDAVSYTHLDVYKRQVLRALAAMPSRRLQAKGCGGVQMALRFSVRKAALRRKR